MAQVVVFAFDFFVRVENFGHGFPECNILFSPEMTALRVCRHSKGRVNLKKMNRKPGDWNCSSCQHLNFSRRDSCQRCGDPRPGGSRGDERGDYGNFSRGGGYGYGGGGGGGGGGGVYGGGVSDVRPGDWYCSAGGCGAHNFASRSSCFKCGSGKEESGGGGGAGYEPSGGRGVPRGSGFGFGSSFNTGSGGRSGWKSGDWICGRSGCNEHNFASRMECFRCSAPRESGVER